MIGILSLLIFFTLILITLVFFTRVLLQLKKINKENGFILIFCLSLIGIVISEGFIIFADSALTPYELAFRLCLGAFSGSSLAVTAMTVMDNISVKKVKTLWRLPLVGMLLAWYLKGNYVFWIFSGLEVLSLFIFFKYKDQYLYCYRQQVKSTLGVLIIAFASMQTIWIFNLGFLLFLAMKFQIINAIKLKLMIIKKGVHA